LFSERSRARQVECVFRVLKSGNGSRRELNTEIVGSILFGTVGLRISSEMGQAFMELDRGSHTRMVLIAQQLEWGKAAY
jgi:hypothetical protein